MAVERVYQLVGARVIRVNYVNSSGYVTSQDIALQIGDVTTTTNGVANASIQQYDDVTWLLNLHNLLL